jgi:hypothetical protein
LLSKHHWPFFPSVVWGFVILQPLLIIEKIRKVSNTIKGYF